VVNQHGGSVALSGDLRLSLDGSSSPASRYNLTAGNVAVHGAFSIGGADAGLDGGSYFNFPQSSIGSITVMTASYDFAAKIDAGQIRLDDTALSSGHSVWRFDHSVFGQTTLSITAIPEPASLTLLMIGGSLIYLTRKFSRGTDQHPK
jgi:hypothetical protein